MDEIKCPNCKAWNPIDAKSCNSCNAPLVNTYSAEKEERLKTEKNPFPIIEVKEDEPWQAKLWKRPFQIAQLIFLSILSLIASIASSTVH